MDIHNDRGVAFLRFEAAAQAIFEVRGPPGIRYPKIFKPADKLVTSAYVVPDDALKDVPTE